MAGVNSLYSGIWKLYYPYWNRANLLSLCFLSILLFFFYYLGSVTHRVADLGTVAVPLIGVIPCRKAAEPAVLAVPGAPAALDFSSHHLVEYVTAGPVQSKFEPCDVKYSEYTPCEDRDRSLRFDRDRLIYRERHCPAREELLRCMIPAPKGYRTPFPWPVSRDTAWFNNVPHEELVVEKAVQNWIQVEGERFKFPGGGTMFPQGADAYIDDIGRFIPVNGGNVRTAVDTGCGVSQLKPN